MSRASASLTRAAPPGCAAELSDADLERVVVDVRELVVDDAGARLLRELRHASDRDGRWLSCARES